MSSFNASATSETSISTVPSGTSSTPNPSVNREVSAAAVTTGTSEISQLATYSSVNVQDTNSVATTKTSTSESPYTSSISAPSNNIATQTSNKQPSEPSTSSVITSPANSAGTGSVAHSMSITGTTYTQVTSGSNVVLQTTSQDASTGIYMTKTTVINSVATPTTTQSTIHTTASSSGTTASAGLLPSGDNVSGGKYLSTGASVAIGFATAFVIMGIAVFVAWLSMKRRARKQPNRNSLFDLNYQLPPVEEKRKTPLDRAPTPFLYRGMKQPQVSFARPNHSRVNRFPTSVRPKIPDVPQPKLPSPALHAFNATEEKAIPLMSSYGAMNDQYHEQHSISRGINCNRRPASSVYSVSSQSSQQQTPTPATRTRVLVAQIFRDHDDEQNLVRTPSSQRRL